MLRASAQTTETEVNIQAINGDASAASVGLPYGPELMRFAESVASLDGSELQAARKALLDASSVEVLVDAAGVAANFQRMVRIADCMGIPVDDMETELGKGVRVELNLSSFATAHNTLGD